MTKEEIKQFLVDNPGSFILFDSRNVTLHNSDNSLVLITFFPENEIEELKEMIENA